MRSCIAAIGADHSEEASLILDDLVDDLTIQAYRDQIKHVRAQQRRLRWDREFFVPSFDNIKQTLKGDLPGSIDDLKAIILDCLETVQNYLRNSDTNSWIVFWSGFSPKDENTCRNHLVDYMRGQLPREINLVPETVMPASNRVDIDAIYRGLGLPIEIKGQWHPDVWNASSAQLDDKYTRDWRADGRGIYVVLWCGDVPTKALPTHPDGLSRPSTPDDLRRMLVERLTTEQRARIDVFVLDISDPKPYRRRA